MGGLAAGPPSPPDARRAPAEPGAQTSSTRASAETFGVLFVAAGVTAVVSWLTGGSF